VHGGLDLHFNSGPKLGANMGATVFPLGKKDVGFGISLSFYRVKVGGNVMIRF